MNYALLALTATQIVIIAVAAFVVALIAVGAIVAIARSMKQKDQPAAPAAQPESEKQPAQPTPAPVAEEPEEELPAPEEVKAEELPVAEESEEELPAPQEIKAEELPASEEPEEELPAPEEGKAEELPVAEEPEEVKAEELPAAEEPAQSAPAPVAETAAPAPAPADGTTRVIYTNDDGWYVNVRYDKSFEAKLIQGDEKLKSYYSELKNELLSYKKVTARKSWQHESFRRGRTTVAKLVIRGKTLRLYLALEPMLYEESKYLVEDASEHAKFAKTPLLYRIKNDRRCRYAKDLIAAAMASAEALRGDEQSEDYASVPYESTDELIAQGLVRIIEVRRRKDGAGGIVPPADEDYEEDEEDEEPVAPEEDEPAEAPPVAIAPRPVTALTVQDVQEEHRVSVSAADTLMADEKAEELVSETERVSDKRRQTIVNIDTLSEYFSDGERVGIEEMKERIPFFNKKATYVKVLARGVLTKTLEVEADDFSLEAVKMIALLGGKIYRTKK